MTDNELIAEFMGLTVKDGWVNMTSGQMKSSNLKYHTSWDALMPVVKKCQNLEFAMNSGWKYIVLTSNISSVYSQVVEFIKWYKTQSHEQH